METLSREATLKSYSWRVIFFIRSLFVLKLNPYACNFQSGPRFAKPGSFEYEYGTRWKNLYELFTQKVETLKREMKVEEEKLSAQMEYARYEHETELLREREFNFFLRLLD